MEWPETGVNGINFDEIQMNFTLWAKEGNIWVSSQLFTDRKFLTALSLRGPHVKKKKTERVLPT